MREFSHRTGAHRRLRRLSKRLAPLSLRRQIPGRMRMTQRKRHRRMRQQGRVKPWVRPPHRGRSHPRKAPASRMKPFLRRRLMGWAARMNLFLTESEPRSRYLLCPLYRERAGGSASRGQGYLIVWVSNPSYHQKAGLSPRHGYCRCHGHTDSGGVLWHGKRSRLFRRQRKLYHVDT